MTIALSFRQFLSYFDPNTSRAQINSPFFTLNLRLSFNPKPCNYSSQIIFKLFAVLVHPRIVPFSFEEPIFAGQAAQVTCLVSEGDLPIDISWTFHGNVDMSALGVSINRIGSKTSMLLIETSMGDHQGNYTCVAKNKAGVTHYTTTLHVHGKLWLPLGLILYVMGEDLK